MTERPKGKRPTSPSPGPSQRGPSSERYESAIQGPARVATIAPPARNGPNGIWSLRPAPRMARAISAPIPPQITPTPAATPTYESPKDPSTSPMRAASLTSPIPMPWGTTSATRRRGTAYRASPMPASTASTPPPRRSPTRMAAANRRSEGYTMRFGTIRCRVSITPTDSMTPRNGAARAAPYSGSTRTAAAANSAPVASSVSGYSTETRAPHSRHVPRSTSQESTGTLSRGRMSAPQLGHLDRGLTIDSPTGTLAITTVRKDPKIRPSTRNSATSTAGMLPRGSSDPSGAERRGLLEPLALGEAGPAYRHEAGRQVLEPPGREVDGRGSTLGREAVGVDRAGAVRTSLDRELAFRDEDGTREQRVRLHGEVPAPDHDHPGVRPHPDARVVRVPDVGELDRRRGRIVGDQPGLPEDRVVGVGIDVHRHVLRELALGAVGPAARRPQERRIERDRLRGPVAVVEVQVLRLGHLLELGNGLEHVGGGQGDHRDRLPQPVQGPLMDVPVVRVHRAHLGRRPSPGRRIRVDLPEPLLLEDLGVGVHTGAPDILPAPGIQALGHPGRIGHDDAVLVEPPPEVGIVELVAVAVAVGAGLLTPGDLTVHEQALAQELGVPGHVHVAVDEHPEGELPDDQPVPAGQTSVDAPSLLSLGQHQVLDERPPGGWVDDLPVGRRADVHAARPGHGEAGIVGLDGVLHQGVVQALICRVRGQAGEGRVVEEVVLGLVQSGLGRHEGVLSSAFARATLQLRRGREQHRSAGDGQDDDHHEHGDRGDPLLVVQSLEHQLTALFRR